MPRRKTRPGLAAPTHSLDPTDWRIYCDILQDSGAPEAEWQRARRIAESLAADPKLVLVDYCVAAALGAAPDNHWLRIGATYFIGAERTVLENYGKAWWRLQWVRDGFARYPTQAQARDEEKLIALNHGPPWDLPHPRLKHLQDHQKRVYNKVVAAFFDGHATPDLPEEYL